MRYAIADSALKHGIAYATILDCVLQADLIGADRTGLLWWCGRSSSGAALEIAGFATDDGAIILIHAMPMEWRRR